MGKRGINTILNKEYILSKVSQISIFSAYLNISEDIIQNCIDTGRLIVSPLRNDIHPTCGFRYDNRGKLKFRDFAGFIWGDCFDIAAYIISAANNRDINISNKIDFIAVLKHIALRFSHIIYGKEIDKNITDNIAKGLSIANKSKPIIELVTRPWNNKDKNYWKQFGVDIGWLNTHFVYAIDQYYINRKTNPEPKYYYKDSDACYAYLLGRDKHGINNIKLYFPNRQHGTTRFITNCNHLEGLYNMDKDNYDYIIITKSTKDRLSLGRLLYNANCSLYGALTRPDIGIINIPAENYKLSSKEYIWIKNKLKVKSPERIICFMDNDKTGLFETIYFKREFNMTAILIPKDTQCKDFSELYCKCGKSECLNILQNTFKTIETYVRNCEFVRDKEEDNSEPF